MLSEYEVIREAFDEVLMHSQGLEEVNTAPLFEQWAKSKQQFIDCMGGKLIYEYPEQVTFSLSEESKLQKIDSFCDYIMERFDALSLHDFFWANKEGFWDNKTTVETTHNGTTIPKGMKMGKALMRYFTDVLSEEELDSIRCEMSNLIQEDKVTGTLCFSVHPLDFLSISESNYNWRSCHALDGEYRCGNLSYMVDDCTMVVYLRSNEMTKLPRFPESVPWNNKKWRCLHFFDREKGLVWLGRQYPFSTDGYDSYLPRVMQKNNCFDAKVRDNIGLRRYLDNPFNLFGAYTDEAFNVYVPGTVAGANIHTLRHRYIEIDSDLYSLSRDMITNDQYSYHYNDLLLSPHYMPRCFRYMPGSNAYNIANGKRLVIGGHTHCVVCGKAHPQDSNSMTCQKCSPYDDYYDEDENDDEVYYCMACGTAVPRDEVVFSNDDFPYCRECWDAGRRYSPPTFTLDFLW